MNVDPTLWNDNRVIDDLCTDREIVRLWIIREWWWQAKKGRGGRMGRGGTEEEARWVPGFGSRQHIVYKRNGTGSVGTI